MPADFTSATGTATPVRAPAWPAVAATASALIAVVAILPATSQLLVAVGGYVLGALVTPGFTVAHRFGRRKAANDPFYVPTPAVERLLLVVLVSGIAAGLLHAWFIATELAKQ